MIGFVALLLLAQESAAVDPVEPPREILPVDPLIACKTLIADGEYERAERCLREGDTNETALAMADVLAAWRANPPPAGTSAPASSIDVTATPPAQDLLATGAAEAMVHGAAAGGLGGFLLVATGFSAARTSEQDSLPWLIGAPAVGALAGAGGAYLLVDAYGPEPGDLALAESMTWVGVTQGFVLQLAVFDQSQDVSTVPLRFATVLGGGALGLAAGAGLGTFADISEGDVAVANSAALWGGVVSALGVSALATRGGVTFPAGTLLVGAGSLVPYAAVLAAHPYLDIGRWPSWLIEAGGAGGLLVGAAAVTVLAASGTSSFDPAAGFLVVGTTTTAGVAVGAAGAYFVTQALRQSEAAE